MIKLTKKKFNHLDPNKEPFDALVDKYEPGMSSAHYTKLFNELKEGLIPIIKKCVDSPNQPDLKLIKHKWPIPVQKQLSEDITKLVHYDLLGSLGEDRLSIY